MLPFEKWNMVQHGFTYAWDSLKCFELKYTTQNFAIVMKEKKEKEKSRMGGGERKRKKKKGRKEDRKTGK